MKAFHRHFRFFVILLLAALVGCQSAEKRAEAEEKIETAERDVRQVKDPSFNSFLGRLRKAVAKRDVRTLSTMMTDNFAYSWEPGGEGYGCFVYWDSNNLWPELEKIVNAQFLPKDNFMTAPAEFVERGEEYRGFRAGILKERGTFKFAYFVPPEEAILPAPPIY